jgi:hypothetical protein
VVVFLEHVSQDNGLVPLYLGHPANKNARPWPPIRASDWSKVFGFENLFINVNFTK